MRLGPALIALAALSSCGGKPVGGKVPRAKPAHVAGVAAAAATLATLADPSKAGRPEQAGKERGKSKTVKESVPEEVLLRAEAGAEAEAEAAEKEMKERPCESRESSSKAPATSAPKQRIDLIPTAGSKDDAPVHPCPQEEQGVEQTKGDQPPPPSDP